MKKNIKNSLRQELKDNLLALQRKEWVDKLAISSATSRREMDKGQRMRTSEDKAYQDKGIWWHGPLFCVGLSSGVYGAEVDVWRLINCFYLFLE